MSTKELKELLEKVEERAATGLKRGEISISVEEGERWRNRVQKYFDEWVKCGYLRPRVAPTYEECAALETRLKGEVNRLEMAKANKGRLQRKEPLDKEIHRLGKWVVLADVWARTTKPTDPIEDTEPPSPSPTNLCTSTTPVEYIPIYPTAPPPYGGEPLFPITEKKGKGQLQGGPQPDYCDVYDCGPRGSRMPQVVQAPVLHIHCASVEGGLPFHFEKASPSLYSGSEGLGDNEEGKEDDLIDIEDSREYNKEEDRDDRRGAVGDALLTGVDRLLDKVEELHRPGERERDIEREREG